MERGGWVRVEGRMVCVGRGGWVHVLMGWSSHVAVRIC